MATKNSLVTVNQNSSTVQPYVFDPDSAYGYDYYDTGEPQSQKHQLFRFFSVLRRYWWLVLGTTLFFTILVLVYEAQKTDQYSAVSTIQVNGETNPAAGGTGNAIIVNQGNDPVYFTTQLRILESPDLLRRVVKAVDLEHNPAFLNPEKKNPLQKFLGLFGLSTQSGSEPPTEPQKPNKLEYGNETKADLDNQAQKLAPYVNAIKNGLTVKPVIDTRTASRETRLIEARFVHPDPSMTAKIANAIADIYVLQNLDRKVERNASASEFLEKRIAELQAQVRAGEERLTNYSRDNQIISLDSSQNTVVQRLGDLNTKLGIAENERISAEAAYRASRQNPLSGTVAESTDPRTSGLESQLTTLRQQLAQLKAEYTDDWPEVQRVQKQIAQIETELQSNRKRAKDVQASQLEQKYKEALARERELRSNFEIQRNAVLAQNEAAINYRIIQQEIDTNRALLADLLKKEKETEVVLNGTPNNVLVAERALVPQNPSEPERTRNVLMAFVVSLLFGIGLAFTANWVDGKLRAYDDVEAQLGIPVVGMIPGIHHGRVKRLVSPRYRSKVGQDSTALVPVDFEQPIVTEAFNQVRASLLLSNGEAGQQTVVVTSGQPHEGKTLTSLNLAKSLAQLGGKTLLIDADLRSPKMHLINNVSNKKGLSTLLRSEDLTLESIDEVINENVSDNLDLMTAGPPVSDPSSLLSSGQMRTIFTQLGGSYRYIVIDSPPALYFADSVMLANEVDSVLIVGRMNFTSTELLTLTKKKLQNVRANIVGVVLNDIPLTNYGYRKSGYYVPDIEIISTNGNGNSNGNGDAGKVLNL
jgi:capsular exopolysaccharide synthesis family protein